jgi:hypothetical protein
LRHVKFGFNSRNMDLNLERILTKLTQQVLITSSSYAS